MSDSHKTAREIDLPRVEIENNSLPKVFTMQYRALVPKQKLTEFPGALLKWPDWPGIFNVVIHQKQISDSERMQYLKTSLKGQARAAISETGFSSQSYYHAWDTLCEKNGRSDVIVNAQFEKIYIHPPISL